MPAELRTAFMTGIRVTSARREGFHTKPSPFSALFNSHAHYGCQDANERPRKEREDNRSPHARSIERHLPREPGRQPTQARLGESGR